MFVKKFEAQSVEEALAQVKRELGPNALILSTENKPRKWYQKTLVEVTAAYDKKKAPTPDDGFDEHDLERIFPHRKSTGAPVEKEETKKAASTTQRKAVSARYIDIDVEAGPPTPRKAAPTLPERFESEFVGLGMTPESAREIARKLVFDYSKKDLSDGAFLQKTKTKLLAASLRTLSNDVFDAKTSWAVTGLPGVGRTSLLVKMALMLKAQNRKVKLVSLDGRKIAGRQELQAYARLVGAEFGTETVTGKGNTKSQLVDCPALSLSSEEEMNELEKVCRDRSVLLVLDAASRFGELLRVVERSLRLQPTAIAFTRVDLVSQRGIIHDVLRAAKLPLLGLSVSQSFTTPFKLFDPAELAGFVLSRPAE